MKKILIILTMLSFQCYSQNNDESQTSLEFKIFTGLAEAKCKSIGEMHKYLNSLQGFKMVKDKREYFTTYKLINKNPAYNLFFSIYDVPGFRIDTPNSYLYDAIIEKGTFREVHKEGDVSFLIYDFAGEEFILNFSIEKGEKHYTIDNYCYN